MTSCATHNLIAKTITYVYSSYSPIDEIICDLAENIKNGFTIAKIDYSKALSCKIGDNYELTVHLFNPNNKK